MNFRRRISAFTAVVLITTMVGGSSFAALAESAYTGITEAETSLESKKNLDVTSGVVRVDSAEELMLALAAVANQPKEEPVNNDWPFPADYIPTEEEIWEALSSQTASESNATDSNASDSNATDSNVTLARGIRANVIELSQTFMDNFNSGTATSPLPALPAGDTVIIKNVAVGQYISKGYEHFTMAAGNQGTYIFQDMNLWGGSAASSKGKGGIKATGGSVKLQNVNFRNFSSRAVYGTGDLQISDCSFIDFAGAMVVEDNDMTIENSYFENCNTMGDNVSAIRVAGKVVLSNSTIINCGAGTGWTGYAGGAVGGKGSGKYLEVNNCYFADNVGPMYGGAISLYQFGGEVKITDSYFENNQVKHGSGTKEHRIKSDGGAVGIFNNGQSAKMVVDGCTFANNTAMDDAGALFAESNTTVEGLVQLEVINSTFAENEAHRADSSGTGGAVQLSLTTTAVFKNNTFTGNICESTTGVKGGGAAIGGHATYSGGWKKPTLSCENNLFVANVGASNSGKGTNVSITLGNMNDLGGNIGYDAAVKSPEGLTEKSVYGVSAPTVAENGSDVAAGCNLTIADSGVSHSPKVLPTYWIAPALRDDNYDIITAGIHADDAVASNTYDVDQRDKSRADSGAGDAGAVEILSAKFDANLGTWATGGTYTSEDPLLFVKELAEDTEYTYVYSAIDVDGSSVKVPADPARDTYIFMGWTLTRDGTDFVTSQADFIPGRIYYAKWSQLVRLDLTYHMNDGSGISAVDPDGDYLEDAGVTVKTPGNFSWNAPANSYFKGWAAVESPAETDAIYQSGATFTITSTNHDLYAIWQEHYQLSYAPGANASEVSSMPVNPADLIDKGQNINLALDVPVRPGWKFEGWKSDLDGDTTIYQPGQTFTMPGQNVVMTAIWSQDKTLDLIYHMNDGSGVVVVDPDGSYAIHTAVSVKSLADLSLSVPANYRFKGWATTPNPSASDILYQSGDVYNLETVNGQLYAQWERFYTVTFVSNGGTEVAPILDVPEGSTISKPSVSRSGYTFLGWYTDDGTFLNAWDFDTDQVMGDMTLYAAWKRKSSGGSSGGDNGGTTTPKPTEPTPTEPQPQEPTTEVPETTAPSQRPDLPPGSYVKEENNVLIIYDADGVPLGYMLPNDPSGKIYSWTTLAKTGDDQMFGKGALNAALLVSFGGILAIGMVMLKRKREQDTF